MVIILNYGIEEIYCLAQGKLVDLLLFMISVPLAHQYASWWHVVILELQTGIIYLISYFDYDDLKW